jgi:hypothetical protein
MVSGTTDINNDTTVSRRLYIALELSPENWKLGSQLNGDSRTVALPATKVFSGESCHRDLEEQSVGHTRGLELELFHGTNPESYKKRTSVIGTSFPPE